MDIKQAHNLESDNRILKSWENPAHLRLRIQPSYSDADYPHFSDLNAFIKTHGSTSAITLLDYGSGSSPYKLYFPRADYRTADVLDVPNLTYRIGADSRIAEQSEIFDLVLSTQVLEHVADVDGYLAESFRLLKKGGALLLTTHGVWEEHGVPYDFNRWNEEGFRRDLIRAGFSEITIYKLTCGLRAGLFLFIRELFSARKPTGLFAKFFFRLFRFSISRIYGLLYRVLDKYWPEQQVAQVGQTKPNPSFYIVIAAIARK